MINKNCFAYAKATSVLEEHCSALNDLQCTDCNFFCHKNKFDKKKMLNDIKQYVETHNADGTRKYSVTRAEVESIISEA